MTVNVFVKCPVCGAVTRIRIPAGYIYETPVRIHCGKCDTLLTGSFVSDNRAVKAYFRPQNCEEIITRKYDYYAEASGEMLVCKVSEAPDESCGEDKIIMPKLSPVFNFMDGMTFEDRARYINFACYSYNRTKNWDKERIKYDLFLHGNYDLIRSKFSEEASDLSFKLCSDWDVTRFIFCSFFIDIGGVFRKSEIEEKLRKINYRINHMDRRALQEYLQVIKERGISNKILTRLFGVMFSFTDNVMFLLPAISAIQYKSECELEDEENGISTCSFLDIKQFYQDTYESLVECSEIIVALDNILNRGDYNSFRNNLDLDKYREQKKGNRVQYLNSEEFFCRMFNLPAKNGALRNAIGHNDFVYSGVKQEIKYFSKGKEVTSSLLDVAKECSYLVQSLFVLTFLFYELQRYQALENGENVLMRPSMYRYTSAQSYCPCGSRKKYKKCCKNAIYSMDIKQYEIEYPDEADILRETNKKEPMTIEEISKLLSKK